MLTTNALYQTPYSSGDTPEKVKVNKSVYIISNISRNRPVSTGIRFDSLQVLLLKFFGLGTHLLKQWENVNNIISKKKLVKISDDVALKERLCDH